MRLTTSLNLILSTFIVSSAYAGSSTLLNEALDASYQERESVQKTYRKNEVVQRPKVEKNKGNNEIPIEVGDELGGGRGSENGLSQYSPHSQEDRSINIDKELDEVNGSPQASKKPIKKGAKRALKSGSTL